MAGSPKSVNTDTPIDSKYLQYINSLSSGGNTTNITSSRDSIKQYVKTKNGIFNGAFGSIGNASYISSGTLDLTANSTGAVVVRRMIYVMPESSNSDIIDNIETNGLELPYQELTLFSSTNNTITIAHNSSAGGTKKNIYCPGDTSYILAPNEAVKLIYDPINTLWIVTGKGANATISGDLDMNENDIIDLGKLSFTSSAIPTDDVTMITSYTGDMNYNALTGDSHYFRINGTVEVEIDADGLDIRNGWLELEERTAPSGLSNHTRLYAKDNGSGKTQLVVIFGSGAEQVIATEP
tara:strand:- start:976 stop:1860 length:885 start_codon:yes stop_codon:yes gene_type:complete